MDPGSVWGAANMVSMFTTFGLLGIPVIWWFLLIFSLLSLLPTSIRIKFSNFTVIRFVLALVICVFTYAAMAAGLMFPVSYFAPEGAYAAEISQNLKLLLFITSLILLLAIFIAGWVLIYRFNKIYCLKIIYWLKKRFQILSTNPFLVLLLVVVLFFAYPLLLVPGAILTFVPVLFDSGLKILIFG